MDSVGTGHKITNHCSRINLPLAALGASILVAGIAALPHAARSEITDYHYTFTSHVDRSGAARAQYLMHVLETGRVTTNLRIFTEYVLDIDRTSGRLASTFIDAFGNKLVELQDPTRHRPQLPGHSAPLTPADAARLQHFRELGDDFKSGMRAGYVWPRLLAAVTKNIFAYIAAHSPTHIESLVLTLRNDPVPAYPAYRMRVNNRAAIQIFAIPLAPGAEAIQTPLGLAEEILGVVTKNPHVKNTAHSHAVEVLREIIEAEIRAFIAVNAQNVLFKDHLGALTAWLTYPDVTMKIDPYPVLPVEVADSRIFRIAQTPEKSNVLQITSRREDFHPLIRAANVGTVRLQAFVIPPYSSLYLGAPKNTDRVTIHVYDDPPQQGPRPPAGGGGGFAGPAIVPPPPPAPAPIAAPPPPPPPPPIAAPPPPPAPAPVAGPPPPTNFPWFKPCGPENRGSTNPITGACEEPK